MISPPFPIGPWFIKMGIGCHISPLSQSSLSNEDVATKGSGVLITYPIRHNHGVFSHYGMKTHPLPDK
jgi:hypothetical protein